jgi:hypothetical protein
MVLGGTTLEKLTIKSYKKPIFEGDEKEMEVQINPNSVSWNSSVTFDEGDKLGMVEQEIKQPRIGGLNPDTLSFKIIFESSGPIDGPWELGLTGKEYTEAGELVAELKNLVHKYDGGTHGIRYLKIYWGNFFGEKEMLDPRPCFRCVLSSMNVDYTLFRPNGTAIRAEVNLSFTGFLSKEELEEIKKTNSPDMSHYYTIKQGSRLTDMCYEIYGSNKYYLEVAKINGLVNFNRLEPGQKLLFPPLGK